MFGNDVFATLSYLVKTNIDMKREASVIVETYSTRNTCIFDKGPERSI